MLKPPNACKKVPDIDTSLAVVLNVHNNPPLVRDTIDALRAWATRKIVIIVDKKGWDQFSDFKHPDTEVVCGVYHGVGRSPYKNLAIGMKHLYERWPNEQWYLYTEFDVLFLNSGFKLDLARLEAEDVMLGGFQHRPKKGDNNNHWLTQDILGADKAKMCHKMLGAVLFHSQKCMKQLMEANFYDEVLERTKSYKGDRFPRFSDYAVEEIIYPSAAAAYGKIAPLANVDDQRVSYRVRFVPEVRQGEVALSTSIAHPVKALDNPVRVNAARMREHVL